MEYEPYPISIHDTQKLSQQENNSNNYLLFFLGGIILMTLHNLALYFQVKKVHYLYFVLLNLMVLTFVLVQTGKIEEFTFDHYKHHERLIMIIGNLNLVAYILFSDKILNLETHFPLVYKSKKYFISLLLLLNIPLAFGLLIPVLFGIGSILALVVYNSVIYFSFRAIKRGESTVIYFFIGNIFFYLGTMISVLMINDLLPRQIGQFTSIEVVELGNMIQLSLFGLALGAIIKDVEEKLKKSEIERELAFETANFKDKFLANMSHEIRTPLNGIIGMLDVYYASHELTEKQKSQLGIVKSSSHSLLNIINDILDLSKLQAGKMNISEVNTIIEEIVSQTTNLFKPLADEKNIKLEIILAKEVPKYIIIDKNRVQQIINNLTSNAIKFTEEGFVKIEIKLNSSNQIIINVKDSGIGIDLKAQKDVFLEFQQIDDSNKRRIDGTGLGLSICKQLVELMGGEIGLISEPNKGSCFWFTLNFKEGVKEIEKTKISPKRKNISFNVLVVEDKAINQKVIELMLKKLGHQIEVANNGFECLEKFNPEKFQIILMDVQMPGMDGVEAVKKLKEKYTNLPPIIGLSANSMEGDAEKYMRLGFDDYLSKPVTLSALQEKIEKYFNK